MPDLLERHAMKQSPDRVERLVRIFKHATLVGVALPMLLTDRTDVLGRWRLDSGLWVLAAIITSVFLKRYLLLA